MTRRDGRPSQGVPAVLTIDELAAIVRISRNKAYEQVRLGVATRGLEGIPAEKIDKQFRISTAAVEERFGITVPWPIPGYHDMPEPAHETPTPTRRTRPSKAAGKPGDEPRLFAL
jgi:hypothetical protein